ncbi:MAG: extracellular solute-binding protein [Bordetella sp.]|nr:extracellular solute-binding protein [Bordetella sp.]
MMHRRSFLRATALAATAPVWLHGRAARAQQRLVVASFGGNLDQVYRRALAGFEARHGVTIEWVPGTAPGNIAKLQAGRAAPEYDVVFCENITQRQAAQQGLLAAIDPAAVPHYAALTERARAPGADGAGIGGFVTGIYYRREAFAQRGWGAPASWDDLARPELGKVLGLERATQVYTLNAVLMLAGADPARIDAGIARFAQIARHAQVLEPTAAKHEEKILLGEYLVGVNSTIRALPLVARQPDLTFVLPREGAVVSHTMVAPVRGAPHAALAQAFVNELLSPEVQAMLMRELFYSPVHREVAVPEALRALGVPDQATLAAMPRIDDDVVVAQRRDWTRRLERALGA